MELVKQNRKKLVLLIAGTFFVFIGWQIYLMSTFRLVSISPNPKKLVASSTESFELNFSKELDSSADFSKLLENSSIVNSVNVSNKTMAVKLKTLEADNSYTFTINNVRSKNGGIIDKIDVKFITKYIPYNKLSDEQKQSQLEHTDYGSAEDPLDNYLPHGDLGYYLTGQFISNGTNTSYVLFARITLSSADVKTDREAAINTQKKLVQDFIRSKNLDPANYPISYEIVDPPF